MNQKQADEDGLFVNWEESDTMYHGAKSVVDEELSYIRCKRKGGCGVRSTDVLQKTGKSENTKCQPVADLAGLALSGGGIRSASFALGVMQALAYNGWLKRIDYLSTVSGGGYIGGSLTWLLHKVWVVSKGS